MPGSGRRLLLDPRIEAIVKESKRKTSERVEISIDSTLESFRIMRDVNITDFIVPGTAAQLKPIEQWTDAMKHAVQSLEWTKYGPKLKLHDKLVANTTIARYLGMLVDKKDITVKSNLPLDQIAPGMTAQEAADLYARELEG